MHICLLEASTSLSDSSAITQYIKKTNYNSPINELKLSVGLRTITINQLAETQLVTGGSST